MGHEDEWIRVMLGHHKCRGADCYAMLSSVDLLAVQTHVVWYYHAVYRHKGH